MSGEAERKAAAARDVCCVANCFAPATIDIQINRHSANCVLNADWLPTCGKHAAAMDVVGAPCVNCRGHMWVRDHREHLPGTEWT